MSTMATPPATGSGSTTVKENAPLIPGRAEVLKSFAELAMGEFPPDEKVAPAEADGEKSKVLSQDKTAVETATADAAALAERAQASGLTVAEQQAAETQALAELTERAQQAGKTVEEQFALEEQAEQEAVKGDDHLAEDAELKKVLTPEVQESINKRIGKEVAKTKLAHEAAEAAKAELEKVKAQLEAKPAPVNVSKVPLGHVNDAAGLQAEAEKAQAAVDQCEDLILQLDEDPEAVETVLKTAQVQLPEFSTAAMKRYLAQVKTNANKTLRTGIPARQEFLKSVSAFGDKAIELLPELKDANSERRKAFEEVSASIPGLKDNPYWPMAAAVQVLGLERLKELQASRTKAAVKVKPLVKPVVIPSPKAQPARVPQPKAGEMTEELRTAVLNGDKNARKKYLESLV